MNSATSRPLAACSGIGKQRPDLVRLEHVPGGAELAAHLEALALLGDRSRLRAAEQSHRAPDPLGVAGAVELGSRTLAAARAACVRHRRRGIDDERDLDGGLVEVTAHGRRLVYSGDLGRYGVPVMRDPVPVETADTLLVESTYGDRLHAADDGTPVLVDPEIGNVFVDPDDHVVRPQQPFAAEAYVDIHPDDAKSLGVEDGDYVWIDSDPSDRPFRGWQKNDKDYKFARLLCRARYYPGTPRGITRMWFNMYGATPGSVEGHTKRPDCLAKNPRSPYQAMFRSGSHQSATRGWLKPTWMTDSLVRKELFGHSVGKGFLPDDHCPTGAPREAIVKISKAEPGGLNGKGLWRPAGLGLRPKYERKGMKEYLAGHFIIASNPKKGGNK